MLCEEACNANDDGTYDIGDAVYLLSFLMSGGPPPPPPFQGCGTDPTADAIGCLLHPCQ